jgi:hypothetical protein
LKLSPDGAGSRLTQSASEVLRRLEAYGWARGLGCTDAELVEAVKVVGISADAVRGYLAEHRKVGDAGTG